MKQQPGTTRHGVRDLNGPHMNGTKYNGRTASCAHFRAPDVIPTFAQQTTEIVDGKVVSTFATFCSGCGVKLYDSES